MLSIVMKLYGHAWIFVELFVFAIHMYVWLILYWESPDICPFKCLEIANYKGIVGNRGMCI